MDKYTLYKIIAFVCVVYLFFYADILDKYKKYKKIIGFVALLALTISFFIPFEKAQQPNSKLSDEDRQKIVNDVVEAIKPYLSSKYPTGSYSLGIHKDEIIRPKDPTTGQVDVDWKSAQILKITRTKIKLKLPDIKFSFGIFRNNTITILKKEGFKHCGYRVNQYEICAEVISIRQSIIVVGIGIKKKT